jgi:hypothetical protein
MSDEPSLSVKLGGSGAPFPIEHKGTVYRVSPPTNLCADFLDKLIVRAALAAAQQSDADIPGLGSLPQFRADYDQKRFRRGAAKWKEWATGEQGNALFFTSLLYPNHPDATLELAEAIMAAKPDEVAVAMGELIPPFFDLLAADEKIPPPLREGFRSGAAAIRAKVAEAASLKPPAG